MLTDFYRNGSFAQKATSNKPITSQASFSVETLRSVLWEVFLFLSTAQILARKVQSSGRAVDDCLKARPKANMSSWGVDPGFLKIYGRKNFECLNIFPFFFSFLSRSLSLFSFPFFLLTQKRLNSQEYIPEALKFWTPSDPAVDLMNCFLLYLDV